jgi:hypothetical protein
MKISFLHGWHSIPGGVKPTYLKDYGHEVINPKLDDDNFEAAVATTQFEFDKHQPAVVVGSSRGGAVAMNIDSGDAKLVLICPAWKNWGRARMVSASTVILHIRVDDVIPFAESEELVRNSGLPNYTLMDIVNDHRLADPESLELMLEACRIDDDDKTDFANDILERDWTGLCYTAAIGWVKLDENQDWCLFHGTVLSEKVGMRIQHAWCERGELVLDLAMPVGSRIIEREHYYRVLQPEIDRVYQSDGALWLASKNKHDGPWDDSEQSEEYA